ncbi:MAG: PAS domain S-box protein [Cyanobacteria bacterium P01_D01_bin.128]
MPKKLKLSLRSLLIVPFVAQVVIVVAVTGWLAHRNGQRAVQDLADQLLDRTSNRIEQRLRTYTRTPSRVTQANADAVDLQQLDPNDPQQWRQHLFLQNQRNPELTFIYFSNPQGDYVELEKKIGGVTLFSVRDETTAGTVQAYQLDSQGQPLQRIRVRPYDPLPRPWYQAALRSGEPIWTEIYEFSTVYPTLGLSFVRPHYNADGTLQGVFGADFTLEDIARYLNGLTIGKTGEAFIIERNGNLIGSSISELPSGVGNTQISILEISNPRIRETAAYIQTTFGSFAEIERSHHLTFNAETGRNLVHVSPYRDPYGLDWLIVVFIPEADFTAQIQTNNRNTLLLILLSLGTTVGLGIVTARRVSRPLDRLGQASQAIAQDQPFSPIGPSRVKELNLLVQNFNQMGADLARSRAQLATYSRTLEDLVEQRTQALRQSEEKFTKAFQVSPLAICISTYAEGRYLDVNDRFAKLFGRPKEEIIGRTSTDLNFWVSPNSRADYVEQLKTGAIRNREWQIHTAVGEIKTVLISAEVLDIEGQTCIFAINSDITSRKAAQERLRQSEERWQLALKGNNDGIWDWKIDTDEIFFSKRYKEILGFANAEFPNQRIQWVLRVHPDDLDAMMQTLDRHLAGYTDHYQVEYRLRNKHDQYVWVLDRGKALFNDLGQPVRMVGSHTDISDRRQAEADLKASQAKFQRLVDDIGDSFVIFSHSGISGVITYVSGGFEAVFGISKYNLVGKSWADVINWFPEDIATAGKAVEAAIARESDFQQFEMRFVHPSGDIRTIVVSQHPTWSETGELVAIEGIVENITQRKQAEQDLARQFQHEQLLASITNQIRQSLDTQAIYQTTVNQIGRAFEVSRCSLHIYIETDAPILLTSAEFLVPGHPSILGVEIAINPYAEAILSTDYAVATDDVYQDPLLETVLDICKQFQVCSLLAIRTSYRGQPNGIIALHQCDRQRHWTTEEVALLESVASQVGIAIAQAALLEQEKQQAEELAQKNADLEIAKQTAEKASRVKSQFLANMSHELRTPLNAILGFTQVMQRDLVQASDRFHQEAADNLGVIQASGDHLLTLINDVLDMAKIEADRVTVNAHPFDLLALLNTLDGMFRLKASAKDLSLQIEPEAGVPDYIVGDEAKLRQVLINLLGNAVKFTSAGQVALRVRRSEQRLYFEVHDTGPGIPRDRIPYLFDPFYQTELGQQSQSGTGLGLSISARYVALMGGELQVTSTLGKGSCFSFYLPATLAQPTAIKAAPAALSVVRLAPGQPTYRILIVEDKWESRQLLMKLLSPLGFDVREAANGQEAVQIWRDWQPHLIWMDMRMPVMDGYEATQRIRAHLKGQAPAIIALTASALEQERNLILSAGCNDFVRKPFRNAVIFDKMREHLGVEYEYSDAAASPPAQPSAETLSPQRLTLLPLNWLHQLREAASLADADWIAQLIDQLNTIPETPQLSPAVRSEIMPALLTLVRTFHCDRIEDLANQAIAAYPQSTQPKSTEPQAGSADDSTR